MPRRLLLFLCLMLLVWLGTIFFREEPPPTAPPPATATRSQPAAAQRDSPLPGELLLAAFADPATPPIDDLRKIHRVLSGYFSVIKDNTRFPIGGNADLAAALCGENIDGEPFIPAGHPVFNADGLLTDRWGSPLSVHPETAREITLRSAGPDREMFTEDDLVLLPGGLTP